MTTIAIDYDGTIGDTNREKVKWIRANLGIEISPWDCNSTDCIPVIGRDAYHRMGEEVYEWEGTLRAEPVPGVADAVRTLARTAVLHVVTARPESRLDSVREWLRRQGVLPCFATIRSSIETSKLAVCRELGADVLVDDDPRHMGEAAAGAPAYLLLQDGREDGRDCAPGVVFCRSWAEVAAFVASRPQFA